MRHSRLDGGVTFALIPIDGDGSVLAVPDTYAPTAEWERLDLDAVTTAAEEGFAAGIAIGGGGSALTSVESPKIDAIAWTTRENPDVISLVGSRVGMSFDATSADDLGHAVRPHLAADRHRALAEGTWAMTDGIAVWRAGDERAAAFATRTRLIVASWSEPWARVDPSRPGQFIDGRLVQATLDEIVEEQNAAPWIRRFDLDTARASRLRALFRRDAHEGVLDDLFDILDLDTACLDLLNDAPVPESSILVILPRTAREQFRDEMRAPIEPAAPRPTSFRRRHPRFWLTGSVFVIVILAGFSITGLSNGRWTALLPGAVALLWIASLVFEGVRTRASTTEGLTDRPTDLPEP